MDISINIEAITFILNKLNVRLMKEKQNDLLLQEYEKYKKAYLNLRMFGKIDKETCIKALNDFKIHLKKHPYLKSEQKDIIIKKIKLIDNELKLNNIILQKCC